MRPASELDAGKRRAYEAFVSMYFAPCSEVPLAPLDYELLT